MTLKKMELLADAELGALLRACREAYGDPYLSTSFLRGRPGVWQVRAASDRETGRAFIAGGYTEIEALRAALAAAPPKNDPKINGPFG